MGWKTWSASISRESIIRRIMRGTCSQLTLDEKAAGISRDKLVQKLREEGVEADVSWPTPIHLQPYYRERFGFKEGDYPIAEMICKTVFQLPIQPFLTVKK